MFPRVTHPCATRVLLHAFDLHVLSLPPAFVLSQDQTLKFNVLPYRLLRSGEERDPVTRFTVRLASNFELATAETFAPEAQTSAAAGVSLSKQTMHRAHDHPA